MQYQLTDISEFVRLAREDVPNTPLPILERITQRVLREFTEQTFCLILPIDGPLKSVETTEGIDVFRTLEIQGDIEERIDHLSSWELFFTHEDVPGETTVLSDAPQGIIVNEGRLTSTGQVWGRDNVEMGMNDIQVGGFTDTTELVLLPLLFEPYRKVEVYIGGDGNNYFDSYAYIYMNLNNDYIYAELWHDHGGLDEWYEPDSYTYDPDTPKELNLSITGDLIEFSLDGTVLVAGSLAGLPPFVAANGGYVAIKSTDSEYEGWEANINSVRAFVGGGVGYHKVNVNHLIDTVKTETEVEDTDMAIVNVPFITQRTALQIPTDLLAHASNIKQGILARLLAQKNKPWSDPARAEMNRRKYEACKNDLKAKYFRDYTADGEAQ